MVRDGSMSQRKRILVITDMDSNGSGYKTICVPLLTGLANLGYDIKTCGLMYMGTEHDYPFSIIPSQSVQDAQAIANNIIHLWKPDVIIVALDLPLQEAFFNYLGHFKVPYIAITPLENGPLTMSWAAPLFNMSAVYFISELGKTEAHKSGVHKAEHLRIGVDTESWRPSTPEEKKQLRKGLGIAEDAFVVLTVADNQERKNLWAGMKAVSLLKKEVDRPVKYILVTRERSQYGWKLRDLAVSLDINQELSIFERGLPQKDLWGLYAIADVYLQPSKAEGLGLPVLDAMACGVPVVATDTGAMHELLEEGRGYLVPAEHTIVDVWGNSLRHFINIVYAKDWLSTLASEDCDPKELIDKAHEYVKRRTWHTPVKQIDDKIKELLNEQNEKAQ